MSSDGGRRRDDRPFLLGEAFGASAPEDPEDRRPCVDGSFKRLARMAGGAETRIAELRFYASFERRNVLDRVPPPAEGKGMTFPLEEARAAADALRPDLEGRLVLICGKRAARAFRLRGVDYFEPLRREPAPGRLAYVVPHPSGVNRWWNDPDNRERARSFFSGILRGEEPTSLGG